MTPRTITLVNGSLGGEGGNTGTLLVPLLHRLRTEVRVEELHLAVDARAIEELAPLLARSDGFVFATGTYWDSWGSPLQRFLERTTPLEAGPTWLGKPAAVVVTMHSVGGKGVLSRLQGVLSTLGLSIPPMSGLVMSLATELALDHPAAVDEVADLWSREDLDVVAHNLLEAVRNGRAFRAWPVSRADASRRWARERSPDSEHPEP